MRCSIHTEEEERMNKRQMSTLDYVKNNLYSCETILGLLTI